MLCQHEHRDKDSPSPSSGNPRFERSRATSCRAQSFDTGKEILVRLWRTCSCLHATMLPSPTDHLLRSTKRIVADAIRVKVHSPQQPRNPDAHYTSKPAPALSAPTQSHDLLRHRAL